LKPVWLFIRDVGEHGGVHGRGEIFSRGKKRQNQLIAVLAQADQIFL